MFRIHAPALILSSLMTVTAAAETSDAGTIVVVIEGARNAQGNIGCSMFDGKAKKSFPSKIEHARKRLTVPIKNRGATCVFTGIPAGTFAISVMHDEDADGELDTKIFGIPTEGWAVSNNHKGKATRGPNFEEAEFKFDGSQMKHVLKLNYR